MFGFFFLFLNLLFLELGDSTIQDAHVFIPPRVRAIYDSKYESQVKMIIHKQ